MISLSDLIVDFAPLCQYFYIIAKLVFCRDDFALARSEHEEGGRSHRMDIRLPFIAS
jgi:hypothetical protein